MEKIPSSHDLIEHKESGWLNGKRYNVGYLYVWANEENIPVEAVDVSSLQDQLDGLEFDAISLGRADTEKPILLSRGDHVIDGKHRLYKAVREGRTSIDAIRLPDDLPIEAELGTDAE